MLTICSIHTSFKVSFVIFVSLDISLSIWWLWSLSFRGLLFLKYLLDLHSHLGSELLGLSVSAVSDYLACFQDSRQRSSLWPPQWWRLSLPSGWQWILYQVLTTRGDIFLVVHCSLLGTGASTESAWHKEKGQRVRTSWMTLPQAVTLLVDSGSSFVLFLNFIIFLLRYSCSTVLC